EDPDANQNQPKAFFLWRSNLFASSGKGAEYFMKHLLGAENGLLAKPNDRVKPQDMVWRDKGAIGKLDLVVDMDFRMVSTPMYSDVVLPAATWYEKKDLSSTDMHPFIHPFNAAVSPMWESKSDWQQFKLLAKTVSEMAKKYMSGTVYDLKSAPLGHNTQGEIAQPYGKIKDWKNGETEPIPGKTMPSLKLVTRDYTKIYDKFITLGPNIVNNYGYKVDDQYDYLKGMNGTASEGIGAGCPLLDEDEKVCDAILR
ncbi:molybdopterin-dependent oxidoreductase, partial [Limosilactobacillus reuteri]